MTTNRTAPTTLVIGARGTTGRRVVDRLTALGRPVRPASRSSRTRFDWNEPATWAPAVEGAEAVYITYHPDLAFPGAAETVGAFIETALAAGARRQVLLTGRGEEGARRAEDMLIASGAEWTVVRCAFFDQNFDEAFAESIANGVIAVPGGDTREPFLDAEDIADVVTAALTEDGHAGRLYELTGPRLLSFADVAEELSAAIGREVRHVPVTAERFAADLIEHGVPAEVAVPVSELFDEVLDGRNSRVTDGVKRALGRPARDVADYARRAAAAGAWDLAQVTA